MRASKRGAKASLFLVRLVWSTLKVCLSSSRSGLKVCLSPSKIQDRSGSSYVKLRKSPSQVWILVNFNRCSQVRGKNSKNVPDPGTGLGHPWGRQGPYPASTSEDKGFGLLSLRAHRLQRALVKGSTELHRVVYLSQGKGRPVGAGSRKNLYYPDPVD